MMLMEFISKINYKPSSKQPSKDIIQRLNTELRVPLVAVWDEDTHKWGIYRRKEGDLYLQLSIPTELTSGCIDFIKQKDQTNSGKDDDEYRQKKFQQQFHACRGDPDREVRKKHFDHEAYELGHLCKHIERKSNQGGSMISVPGPMVGINPETGKPIRVYRKQRRLI